MPGSPVSVADYLAIEIACRHTAIQRSTIADYFDITVNALNARLRTCSDRLQQFPNFVAYGINILEASLRLRPEFESKVHPIWEISKRLLQSYTNGTLQEELEGFLDNRGAFFEFLKHTDFKINGCMPQERPNDELHFPATRKRKHGGDLKTPSRQGSPSAGIPIDLAEVGTHDLSESARSSKKSKLPLLDRSMESVTELKGDHAQAAEKASGKGSRSEPYSQHELCSIFIARRIRMLDWDTISWALSRFKTPTVAILSDARAAFDQYHDLIVETLRLCCWPQDSMYLIACAASECTAALERGSWADELKNFRNNRGVLYQIYMQRRLERLYRKSFETPSEKRQRRRRERIFGYEGLSIEDFGNLPAKKRVGIEQSQLKDINRMRKRRTKEEMQRLAEEKASAKAILKANGLKANGEAMADRRKINEKVKKEVVPTIMPPTFDSSELAKSIDQAVLKRKGPRRKYDIPENERIAFSNDARKDRRMSYDVALDDHILSRQLKGDSTGLDSDVKSTKYDHHLQNIPKPDGRSGKSDDKSVSNSTAHAKKARATSDELELYEDDTVAFRQNVKACSNHDDHHEDDREKSYLISKELSSHTHPHNLDTHGSSRAIEARVHDSKVASSNSALPARAESVQEAKSPTQSMSISNLLDRPHFRSQPAQITGSFESAAASPFTPHANLASSPEKVTSRPQEQKARSSMSLAALLN